MGADGNKVYLPVLGRPVLAYVLNAFLACKFIDEIVVVTRQCDIERCSALTGPNIRVIAGGNTRQASVLEGIQAVTGDFVLVHDGARAMITPELIRKIWEACIEFGAAVPGVPCKDTLKTLNADGWIAGTMDREKIWHIQTPQAFRTQDLKNAHIYAAGNGVSVTDDCALAEYCNIPVKMVEGSYENIKLTTPEDLAAAEEILRKRGFQEVQKNMRIGQGYDVHKLTEGRDLILCGVKIPYEKGLLGHSDADVALHALADALLGAAALGDIGMHFPDSDPQYKGASSMLLLAEVVRLVRERGYAVANTDVTIVCQRPKLADFIPQMRENVAAVLHTGVEQVNIKATTTEKLGFEGRGEGISAMAVVLLQEKGCTYGE